MLYDDTFWSDWLSRNEKLITKAVSRSLNGVEIEDAISIAKFKIWRRRKEYDPSKALITTWAFMIARGAVPRPTVRMTKEVAFSPFDIEASDAVSCEAIWPHSDNETYDPSSTAESALFLLRSGYDIASIGRVFRLSKAQLTEIARSSK